MKITMWIFPAESLRNSSRGICVRAHWNGFTAQKKTNMSEQHYFYLISGLPDISAEDAHLPFSAKTFLDEHKDQVDENDFRLLCYLYYPNDNRNLLDILLGKKETAPSGGRYSLQELKKGIEGDGALPDYMNRFISAFGENKNRFSETEWEARLTEAYFREAMNSENGFLNRWMEFELNLKNLLLLTKNRKQQLPFAEFLMEANGMAAIMKQNPSVDLSTESAIDFMSGLSKIMETGNIVERERKIDWLRWRKLEEMTFFNYFTVEAIMSFLIKLMIVERWVKLKHDNEATFLPSLLSAYLEKIEMPETVNIQ
ncbi:hypothetical protein CKK33_17230 [Mucilaginibacter sp. MD40]|nr:hypothetical protein CKK33_17230 [Mucilaginibacter sp. MD40]